MSARIWLKGNILASWPSDAKRHVDGECCTCRTLHDWNYTKSRLDWQTVGELES